MHEGITYSCEHCDYKAKWKGDLLQYVESMHEGVTYTCDHCSDDFLMFFASCF